MQATVATAAANKKVFDPLSALKREADAPAGEAAPEAAAAKTLPATADGDVNAPMAAATLIVKRAVGRVRVKTLSTTSDSRSRSISRPRARRCRTASSLISSASATALAD